MTSFVLALLLPLVGGFLMFILRRVDHYTRGFTATALAAGSFLLILIGGGPVYNGETLRLTVSWFPSLDLSFVLYVDGLAQMFALLITGIGTLVCLYAVGYLHDERIDVMFWFSFLLFMGSMLGVVLAGDFVSLLVFWEMTSVTSFLLIGINFWSDESKRGALNALIVTAMGGLCLLTGLLMIGFDAGTFVIPEFNQLGIGSGGLMTAALILVLIGAFTKSAHVPFHFWLPQAMAAPTPVSAYLHSATMVKAGIYLIARLYPGLEPHAWFTGIVMVMGLVTFLVGGALAVSQEDLKALLAYSTVSQLGMITFMLGINTRYAMVGAIVHILAHATFKGALFMGAGAIDHERGTRNLDELGPLWGSMPLIAVLMILASLSMAAIVPFSGFVSKELMFNGVMAVEATWGFWLLVGSVVASILTFLYSMRLAIELPFGDRRSETDAHPHKISRLDSFCLAVPPLVLVGGTVVLGAGLSRFTAPLRDWIREMVAGVTGSMVDGLSYSISLWHGFLDPAFLLTGLVVLTGLVLFAILPSTRTAWQRLARIPGPEAFNRVVQDNLIGVCYAGMKPIVRGPLSRYIRWILLFVVGIGFLVTSRFPSGVETLSLVPAGAFSYEWFPFVLVVFIALAMLLIQRPVTALLAVGSAGFLMASIFLVYRAPDLVLTQTLVEIVSIVILLWIFKDIDFRREKTERFRPLDFGLAAAVSGWFGLVLMTVLPVRESPSLLAEYFVAASVPEAFGYNMVNVILVDFRALDTFGEITVLGIAMIGVLALMKVTFSGEDTTNSDLPEAGS